MIKKLSYLESFTPPPTFRFEDNVSLGKVEMHPGSMFGFGSYMNSGFVRSNVRVGRFCSIGRNVTLGSGAHDFHAASTSSFFKINSNPQRLKLADNNLRIRVDIGNDVWIGDNAYIMSGVNVGNGAIIAAGAIVTKDVPDYSIYAGVPAKSIGSRFENSRVNSLCSVKFWELHPTLLSDLDISDIDLFLETVKKLRQNPNNISPVKYRRFEDLKK